MSNPKATKRTLKRGPLYPCARKTERKRSEDSFTGTSKSSGGGESEHHVSAGPIEGDSDPSYDGAVEEAVPTKVYGTRGKTGAIRKKRVVSTSEDEECSDEEYETDEGEHQEEESDGEDDGTSSAEHAVESTVTVRAVKKKGTTYGGSRAGAATSAGASAGALPRNSGVPPGENVPPARDGEQRGAPGTGSVAVAADALVARQPRLAILGIYTMHHVRVVDGMRELFPRLRDGGLLETFLIDAAFNAEERAGFLRTMEERLGDRFIYCGMLKGQDILKYKQMMKSILDYRDAKSKVREKKGLRGCTTPRERKIAPMVADASTCTTPLPARTASQALARSTLPQPSIPMVAGSAAAPHAPVAAVTGIVPPPMGVITTAPTGVTVACRAPASMAALPSAIASSIFAGAPEAQPLDTGFGRILGALGTASGPSIDRSELATVFTAAQIAERELTKALSTNTAPRQPTWINSAAASSDRLGFSPAPAPNRPTGRTMASKLAASALAGLPAPAPNSNLGTVATEQSTVHVLTISTGVTAANDRNTDTEASLLASVVSDASDIVQPVTGDEEADNMPPQPPHESVPIEPAPIEAAPIEPAPIEAAPIESALVGPAPIESALVGPAPIESARAINKTKAWLFAPPQRVPRLAETAKPSTPPLSPIVGGEYNADTTSAAALNGVDITQRAPSPAPTLAPRSLFGPVSEEVDAASDETFVVRARANTAPSSPTTSAPNDF